MKKSNFLVPAFFVLAACKAMTEPAPPPPLAPAAAPMQISATISEPMLSDPGRGVLMAADRGVLMLNGIMMTVKDGQPVPMTETMTMDNGDKVMTNGDIVHKDGTKAKMKEGMIMKKSGSLMDKTGNTVEARSTENDAN